MAKQESYKVVDLSCKSIIDAVVADLLESAEFVPGIYYLLNLSGNNLTLRGLRRVVDLLKKNDEVAADVSCNSFGFTDAFRVLKDEDALDLLGNGCITFDSKAVKPVGARLSQMEGDVAKLQSSVSKLSNCKDFVECSMGSMSVESDPFEEEVSQAVLKRLDPGSGEILAVTYRYQGAPGDLDGLVIGNLEGEPVYVLVEAKRDMDRQRFTAVQHLEANSMYIDDMLTCCTVEGVDAGEEEAEDFLCDYEALKMERLRGRTRLWALGGECFKQPEKLHLSEKTCFLVRRDPEGRCVALVKKRGSERYSC